MPFIGPCYTWSNRRRGHCDLGVDNMKVVIINGVEEGKTLCEMEENKGEGENEALMGEIGLGRGQRRVLKYNPHYTWSLCVHKCVTLWVT